MTLRQLLWMAEGHGRDCWSHTSLLACLIANAHRNPKKGRPFKLSDFDPYARQDRRSRRVADKEDLAFIREALEAQKGS